MHVVTLFAQQTRAAYKLAKCCVVWGGSSSGVVLQSTLVMNVGRNLVLCNHEEQNVSDTLDVCVLGRLEEDQNPLSRCLCSVPWQDLVIRPKSPRGL